VRVLVIADPHVPVPPVHYGGTERIAHLLCEGLHHRGLGVDVIAGAGSKPYGGRLYTHEAPGRGFLSRAYRKILFQFLSLWAARKADVVITFGRPDYLWSLFRTKMPIVVRFANPVDQNEVNMVLTHRKSRLRVVGMSRDQFRGLTPENLFSVVPNAVNPERFNYSPVASTPPYLVFLGRVTANKGVHLAIGAARRTGLRLIIAGNLSDKEPGAREYFEARIKPELRDGVEWIGPVDDAAKAKLLGGATAMLFPIQWREPFGIVMIEALACGCPVIAWRNGSVPEVIRHGKTGFIVDSLDEMTQAIRDISTIDRAACRADVEARFSPPALVDGYMRVFQQVMGDS
jgi:glycosyltransferase involved in cell wall biosynthesis